MKVRSFLSPNFLLRRSCAAEQSSPAPTVRARPPFAELLRKAGCACGGGCPTCADELHRRGAASGPGDSVEVDADRSAGRALARAVARPARSAGGSKPTTSAAEDAPVSAVPADLPASVGGVVRSAGEPLATDVRSRMESGFQVDLSAVRIHRDAAAALSAHEVNAEAYAVGPHIAFGTGRFDPASRSGELLLAHELAHVVQSIDAPGAGAQLRRYGQRDGCKQSFLEDYLWPGHPLAKRMIAHSIRAMCGAEYGNRTARNKEAAVQMKVLFGADWRTKSPELYRVLWRLYSAMEDNVMYTCTDTGRFFCQSGPTNTEWAFTHEGNDIHLCWENLSTKDVKWFARIIVHEMGHRALGLGHGTDDESMTCTGETDDAECYGLLAESMWANVDPEYVDPIADLCHGNDDPGSTVRDPKHWDD